METKLLHKSNLIRDDIDEMLYFTDQMQLAFEFVHLTQQIRVVTSFQHDFPDSIPTGSL